MSSSLTGPKKPDLIELPRLKDRISFIYLEKCTVSRENGAVKIQDKTGISKIPSAAISVILLGPGTSITQQAVQLIADCGISLVWTGENGVRFYAGGRPLSRNSRLLERQAESFANQRKHLDIVRKMYSLRFPDEDTEGMTISQLRGKEGIRMKKLYQEQSKYWKVPWNGRNYDPEDFDGSDPVNKALSTGNVCLYGLVHSVICSLGLSPGLGFIHVGLDKSFIYDIADLYKAELTIPAAFELASVNPPDIEAAMRRRMRDKMFEKNIIGRIVYDLIDLLKSDEDGFEDYPEICLWNNHYPDVPAGVQYGN